MQLSTILASTAFALGVQSAVLPRQATYKAVVKFFDSQECGTDYNVVSAYPEDLGKCTKFQNPSDPKAVQPMVIVSGSNGNYCDFRVYEDPECNGEGHGTQTNMCSAAATGENWKAWKITCP